MRNVKGWKKTIYVPVTPLSVQSLLYFNQDHCSVIDSSSNLSPLTELLRADTVF